MALLFLSVPPHPSVLGYLSFLKSIEPWDKIVVPPPFDELFATSMLINSLPLDIPISTSIHKKFVQIEPIDPLTGFHHLLKLLESFLGPFSQFPHPRWHHDSYWFSPHGYTPQIAGPILALKISN